MFTNLASQDRFCTDNVGQTQIIVVIYSSFQWIILWILLVLLDTSFS